MIHLRKLLTKVKSKCLISKFNRLVNIATTSKTPEPTSSQVETSTIPENNVNDISINNSINSFIPPSIKRSLPATPIAIMNTTPRLLSIINSAMNAKLEQLECKTCGKLWQRNCFSWISLEFEMKHQLSKINTVLTTSEKTNLKNKVKLLKVQNNILKSDVFYKQKFIDTTLEYSTYLANSQSFDITAVIPVADPEKSRGR